MEKPKISPLNTLCICVYIYLYKHFIFIETILHAKVSIERNLDGLYDYKMGNRTVLPECKHMILAVAFKHEMQIRNRSFPIRVLSVPSQCLDTQTTRFQQTPERMRPRKADGKIKC